MWRQVAWRAGACGGSVRRHSSAQRQHLPLNSSRQRKRQQVEAGAAVGGATVAAGGSCRCLAVFRHRLTLPPTVARRTKNIRHPLTPSPPLPPQQQAQPWQQLLLLRHIRHPLTPSPHSSGRSHERGGGVAAAGAAEKHPPAPHTHSPTPPTAAGAAVREEEAWRQLLLLRHIRHPLTPSPTAGGAAVREEEAWLQLLLLKHTRHPLTPSPPLLPPNCCTRSREMEAGGGGGGDGPFHLVLRSRVPSPPVLPQPPESSLTVLHDPLSDYLRASRPVVSRVLSALVTHSTAPLSSVSALVTTVAGFASSLRLDYAAHLVSGPAHSPSSRGAPVFPLEVLEDRHFELGFLAAAVPHLCAMVLAPEGDLDTLNIPISRTHAEALSGTWASYWIAAEEAEMASCRSTGTYVDAVPPPGANVVNGMWLYKVKRPPGAPPVFKARYVARDFS
ncbi:unnamed protein product [Closterium sp. NIES-54]